MSAWDGGCQCPACRRRRVSTPPPRNEQGHDPAVSRSEAVEPQFATLEALVRQGPAPSMRVTAIHYWPKRATDDEIWSSKPPLHKD